MCVSVYLGFFLCNKLELRWLYLAHTTYNTKKDSWKYKLKSCQADSQIWKKQIIEIFNPYDLKKKAIIIGNVYRPPYNIIQEIAILHSH